MTAMMSRRAAPGAARRATGNVASAAILSLLLLASCARAAPILDKAGRFPSVDNDREASERVGEGVTLVDNAYGQFTLGRATDGAWLLYPSPYTSYLSVNIDGSTYTNYDGGLAVQSGPTWITATVRRTVYSTSAGLQVTQDVEIAGDAAIITVTVANASASPRTARVRYLLDTQVDINDGSPLSASGVADPVTGGPVCTHETDIPVPAFSAWYGYDMWPGPTLTSTGTLATRPARAVFAWWPDAFGCPWDYTPNPTQAFYTPGYTYSPYSDSCVLLYFDLGVIAPGGSAQVKTAYGLGEPNMNPDRALVIQRLQELDSAIQLAMQHDADVLATIQAQTYHRFRADGVRTMMSIFTGIVSLNFSQLPAELAPSVEAFAYLCQTLGWAGRSEKLMNWLATSFFAGDLNNLTVGQLHDVFLQRIKEGSADIPGTDYYQEYAHSLIQSAVDSLPAPLPEGYPTTAVCTRLSRLTQQVLASTMRETAVVDPCGSGEVILGSLLTHRQAMQRLYENYDTISGIHTGVTYACFGAAGAKVVVWGLAALGAIPTGGLSLGGGLTAEGFLASVALPACSVGGGVSSIAELSARYYMALVSVKSWYYYYSDLMNLTGLAAGAECIVSPSSALRVRTEEVAQRAPGPVTVLSSTAEDVPLSAEAPIAWAANRVIARNDSGGSIDLRARGELYVPVGTDGTPLPYPYPTGMALSLTSNLAAGAEAAFDLAYPVASSHLSGGNTYLSVSYLYSGSDRVAGPAVAVFHAGSAEVLSSLEGQTSAVLSTGLLASGDAVEVALPITADMAGVDLILVAPDPEADLHLYDPYWNHTGLNYDTGEVDLAIAGSAISDPGVTPEVIHLALPSPGTYTVQLVARPSSEDLPYALLLLTSPFHRALLTCFPSSVNATVYTGDTFQSAMVAQEVGGQEGLFALETIPTALSGPPGSEIGVDRISCPLATTTLEPGLATSANLAVTIPQPLPAGTYAGQVTISGHRNGDGSVSAISIPLTLEVRPFFADIPPDHWARSAIRACYRSGIVQGYWDGYRPEQPVTRDQMAAYISRALAGGDDLVPDGPPTPHFSDVPTDYWAYRYVEFAYANHIVGGYWDGYRPEAVVDRAQMAVFVTRAIVLPHGDEGLSSYTPPASPHFADVPSDHWAYPWVEYLYGQGVVQGYWDGYHPGESVTRAQMAVYMQRAFALGT